MYKLSELRTFVAIANSGSINKAAETLYLSPNSVMHQINSLENEIGDIKLFERTNRGVALTYAGIEFLKDAKDILEKCEESINNVRNTAYKNDIVKLATFYGFPLDTFDRIWKEAKEKAPSLNVEIVLYDGSKEAHNRYINGVGEIADVVVGVLDARYFNSEIHKGLKLAEVTPYALLNMNHKLANRKTLKIEDLIGTTCLFPDDKWSEAVDSILEEIQERDYAVNVHTYNPDESYDIYSLAAGSDNIVICAHAFAKTHPFLMAIPIINARHSSFGLIYSKNPTERVKKFISVLENIL